MDIMGDRDSRLVSSGSERETSTSSVDIDSSGVVEQCSSDTTGGVTTAILPVAAPEAEVSASAGSDWFGPGDSWSGL